MGVKLLGKIKIHEIAKEIGLASKEIIERAQKLGISVTSHLSSIDEDQAKTIKESFGTSKKQNDGEKTAKAKEQKDTKKESSPVIIRREVIISEEEERKNIEKQKRNEEHAKNVGFVERNNNKDYNIVYRNKQTKPLTVNELFGIKPKEEKKAEKVEEKKVEVPEKKEEPKEEKSSKGTGLFGLFKKKEEIEKNVENNAIEEIFAYKNNGPYIPTEEKKTEEENTKSNLDFEKMYSQTFGVKKEEDNQDAEKVTEYKYADAKNLSVFEEKEEYKNVPAYTYRGAVFSTYLIIEMGNEMYIIDQHAAHERVLYEEIKKNYYQTAEKESQIMLLPDIINLSHKEKAIVKENVDLFKKAGFMIEEFGENAIRLIGVPSICMDMDTKELFLEILDTIDTVAITAKQEKEDRFIATIACKAAVKANMDLSKEEVDNLMKKLLVLPNPFTCPHGRPTAIKMSKIDLEKKFNRRK